MISIASVFLKEEKSILRGFLYSAIILALIGLADSVFLTFEHYNPTPIPCRAVSGCESVTTSIYSEFLGLPVALFGVGYYLSLVGLLIGCLRLAKKKILKLALFLVTLGFLASARFVYLQIFVLKSICLYCMLSATVTTLLLILLILVWFCLKQNEGEKDD